MNGLKHIPRLEATAGRLIRVSDFFRDGGAPPVPSYFSPGQTPYQTTNFLYSAPTVLIDLNVWTPDGTDVDFELHGLLEPRAGAWSYVTPNAWVPGHAALRLPQYASLNWNARTFDEVPGDRPDLDEIQEGVRSVYGAVRAWLESHRPGRTFASISVQTGITTVPPQPPVENDPIGGIFPAEEEATNIVRGGSTAVILADPSATFLGTNAVVVSVDNVAGASLECLVGSSTEARIPPTGDRFASYKMLVYDNPADPAGTQATFDENVAALEAAGWGHEAEYGGDPAGITFDALRADLAAFFHFDPDTGIDLPLD